MEAFMEAKELIIAVFFLLAGIIWLYASKKGVTKLLNANRTIILTLCFGWAIVFFISFMTCVFSAQEEIFSLAGNVIKLLLSIGLVLFVYKDFKESRVES